MRAPELLAEVAVRPPAGGHAISKGHAYSPRLLPVPGYVDDPVLPVEVLLQSYIRDVLLGGRPHGTPGDQAVRLIHPSTTCQSPKTQQDRERGDELTARVFAPGRSILSTMGAIL